MNLGTVLKQEIKRQGKSQKYIAEIIGISRNAISLICSNNTLPHKKTLEKILKYLNIELEFIIKDSDSLCYTPPNLFTRISCFNV
jgi:transcriptional regulator with XRE-family HTH domain